MDEFKQWLFNIQWTPDMIAKWQELHTKGSRLVRIVGGQNLVTQSLEILPTYKDMITMTKCNSSSRKTKSITLFLLIHFVYAVMFFQ